MGLVNTVSSPVDTAELGFTLLHEHLIVMSPGMRENWPDLFDRDAVMQRSVDALREAKANGVDTIVDMTTVDLGRDIGFVQEAVQKSGMRIVVATGLHRSVPRYLQMRSPDVAARLFVRDIQDGIQGTAVKAAIIKAASDGPTLDGIQEIAFRGAARAHRATGVPLATHTNSAQRAGLDQQRLFAEEGVDLNRVLIGHSGDTEDLDYLQQMLDRGSYLGMDRFGLDQIAGQQWLTTPQRVQVIAALAQRGYAGQMVLSHDASIYLDMVDPDEARRTWPDWHFNHIPRDVVPALREAGVSDSQINQMTRANPRAIFERQGAY